MRFESLDLEAYSNYSVMCMLGWVAFLVNEKGLLGGPPLENFGVGGWQPWYCIFGNGFARATTWEEMLDFYSRQWGLMLLFERATDAWENAMRAAVTVFLFGFSFGSLIMYGRLSFLEP